MNCLDHEIRSKIVGIKKRYRPKECNGNLQWHLHRVAIRPLKSGSNKILEMLVLEDREKTGVPGEKPLGAEKRTNNKPNPHIASSPRIHPEPHRWEASALTTAPSLLPKRVYC